MTHLTHPLWERVKALELPPNDYVIWGSAPLVAHGLITRVRDVDIVARGEAWTKTMLLAEPVTAEKGDRVVRLEDGQIEIFDGYMGFDADALIEGAVILEGLPFADLRNILAFKRHLNRAKDVEDIRLLEAYLKTP